MVMDYLTVTEIVHYAKLKDANVDAHGYKPHQLSREEKIRRLMGRLKHDVALRLLRDERSVAERQEFDYLRGASTILLDRDVQRTRNALLSLGHPAHSVFSELYDFIAGAAENRRHARATNGTKPVSIEQDISGAVAGVRVRGRMDMMETAGDAAVITELKIRNCPAKHEKYDALQAAAYGLLHGGNARVVLRTLPDDRTQDIDCQKWRDTIETLAREINGLPEAAHVALWRNAYEQ